jgi:hypothetical protein
MDPRIQTVIVVAIVAVVAGIVLRSAWKRWQNRKKGGCGCDHCPK